MTHAYRSLPLALTLALGLGMSGCALHPSLLGASPDHVMRGDVSLSIVPRVVEGQSLQAVVTRPIAASIARLDVIPMVETSGGSYQPMKADGTPTAHGDEAAIVLSQAAPELILGRGIQLSGLARNTRYRILAQAYDAQGMLLSQDAGSSVDLNVGIDDAPTSVAVPVKLADVPFAAMTHVTLIDEAVPNYTRLETHLSTVVGSVATLVDGTSQVFHRAQLPTTLTLDGLRADTTYRLDAVMYDASDLPVATASVEIAVSHDDAPADRSLTLTVPRP
jgi:hypothetical protein